MQHPLFTIGIPTFNRHDLLRETLQSILVQSFTDFEIIVGNDYTSEVLTQDRIGISDPRIRIVNHPVNLREVGNLNAVFAEAKGRYFTWQFDDDLYEPGFLKTAHDILSANDFPPALFPSYRVLLDSETLQFNDISYNKLRQLSGREYLAEYSAERLKLISTCGLFDTEMLRSIVGGAEEICSDSIIGLYFEYLFLVKCALLGKILYIDAPFVIFRVHSDSWGEANTELDKYLEAGQKLLQRTGEVFRHPDFLDDFDSNLIAICKMHLITFATKSSQYEIARKRFGLRGHWSALTRSMKEACAIRKTFTTEGGSNNFSNTFAFVKIQIYCCRLISGKLRQHWFSRSS